MTTAQRLIEQGRKEGRQEGRLEGRLEGQRELLLKQLRLRFGSVSRRVMTRINGASAEQLDRWAERVITANSPEETLAD